jgi:hypothetical protein
MAKNTLVALQNAVEGLLYMSESDEPFQVVHSRGDAAGGFKKAQALALCGREEGAPVKSVDLNEFFKDLVQGKDWYGEEEKATVRRYRGLLKVLREQLSEPKVFCVGQTQVDILIIGKTKDGQWAGIKTRAVET